MEENFSILLTFVLLVHFIADFVLQSEYMSMNKWKSLWALSWHVFVYFSTLVVILSLAQFKNVWLYCSLNGCIHFIVDYFSSKVTHYLWEAKEIRKFFIVIGFDQFLHMAFLISFYHILVT